MKKSENLTRACWKEFEDWLKSAGLASKTIKKHSSNIDFYINDFLLDDEPTEPQNGITGVGSFLGFWFIKKAMWASESNIKSNAGSLKKFYAFLEEKGLLASEDLLELNQEIKTNMPKWLKTIKRYEDTDIEDVWE